MVEFCENSHESLGSIKAGNFFYQLCNYQFFQERPSWSQLVKPRNYDDLHEINIIHSI
jgi:hypothetical protein